MKIKNPQPGTAQGLQRLERYKISSFDNHNRSHGNKQAFLSNYSAQRLTDAIEILENTGYHGDTALFMLGWIGGL